jgi:hypothetical protein
MITVGVFRFQELPVIRHAYALIAGGAVLPSIAGLLRLYEACSVMIAFPRRAGIKPS